MRDLRPILLTITAVLALAPMPAFAYIDPNTGGLLFQLLTPILTIIGGIFVFMRDAITSFIGRAWQFLRSLASARE
jgi:hypothetical protein